MTSVWIIEETIVVRQGHEAGDCDYSHRIFEIFSNQKMAQATCDFLNQKALKAETGGRYSTKEHLVLDKVSPMVEGFLEKSRNKEALHTQLAEHWKAIKDIENKLRGCDA